MTVVYQTRAELQAGALKEGDLLRVLGNTAEGDRAVIDGRVRPIGYVTSNELVPMSNGLLAELFPGPGTFATEGYVQNQANAGDSQLSGGIIWPLNSQESAQIGDDLTGYSFVRLQGEEFSDITLFEIIGDSISGTIDSFSLTSPYTITIDGSTYPLYIKAFRMKRENTYSAAGFGAAGLGSDYTTNLEQSASVCDNRRYNLYIPGGDYQMLRPLIISTDTYGDYSRTRIEFPEGFINPETVLSSRFFAVHNVNYSDTYEEATADKYNLYNIDFIMSMINSSAQTAAIVGCSNTNGVNIYRNRISSEGTPIAGARTCLSFYHANKHMEVFGNDLINENNYRVGGCLWLQGGSGATADDGLGSENIRIYRNNIFQQRPDDGDGAMEIWGAGGELKDVLIENNVLYLDGGGQGITVFNTANPSATYSRIHNVKINNNTIYGELRFNCIRLGGSNLPNDITDLTCNDNIIYHTPSPRMGEGNATYAIRLVESAGDISVQRNHIVNIAPAQQGNVAIDGFQLSDNNLINYNVIDGDYSIGVGNATSCKTNKIQGCAGAIRNCRSVLNNECIDISSYIFQVTGNESYLFKGNEGNTIAGANFVLNATSGYTGELDVDGNSFVTDDASTRAMTLQGSGRNTIRNNKFTGTGNKPNGSIAAASGNYYYDTYDDFTDDPNNLGADLRLALPDGHFVRNSAPSVDGNNLYIFGWTRISSLWQEGYMKTTSP